MRTASSLCSLHASVRPGFNLQSPPCNNLRMRCIKSSVLRSDRNKMDVAQGGEYVKMHANKLFTGIAATRGNFYGEKILSFTGDDQDVYEMWWTDTGVRFTAPAMSAHPRGCIKEGWERRKQGEVSAKRNKVKRKQRRWSLLGTLKCFQSQLWCESQTTLGSNLALQMEHFPNPFDLFQVGNWMNLLSIKFKPNQSDCFFTASRATYLQLGAPSWCPAASCSLAKTTWR